MVDEEKWFEHGMQLLTKVKLIKEDYISLAAFNASLESNPPDPPAVMIIARPIFEESYTNGYYPGAVNKQS